MEGDGRWLVRFVFTVVQLFVCSFVDTPNVLPTQPVTSCDELLQYQDALCTVTINLIVIRGGMTGILADWQTGMAGGLIGMIYCTSLGA